MFPVAEGERALDRLNAGGHAFIGAHIYTSYNPFSADDQTYIAG